MRLNIRLLTSVLAVTVVAGAQNIAPNTDVRVKLASAISSRTNQKGDKITAQVLSPDEFKGDIVEGQIREAKSSGKINKSSTLNFTFQTLYHGGAPIPIQSQVKSFTNSKGQANVDEEGQVIQRKGNTGKVAAATAAGAIIGALAGGAKGASIGAAAGAAASLILVSVAVKGPNITFDSGSELLLSVNPRR
jgi:hypothetical protein